MNTQSFADFRGLVREDLVARCRYEQKPVTRATLFKLALHPGGASVVLYRLQSHADRRGPSVLGMLARWLNLVLFTSDFSSRAQIAGGFVVVHAVGNVVDDDVKIGPRCVLFSQNAVTRSPFTDAATGDLAMVAVPVIESDVVFGIGAAVHGGVRIGAGCRIGMNSLVDADAAPASMLLGIPARVTGRTSEATA